MVYITGDTHGDFARIASFCKKMQTTPENIVIILGDAALNYFADERDVQRKKYVSKLPVTFFCIHGNHEARPDNIASYQTRPFQGGKVFYETEYPSLLFGIDGEAYDFDGLSCLVIGGAYSVDKYYLLMRGYQWFPDEQPSDEIKKRVKSKISAMGGRVDIVLSHTCPLKYEPTEVFLPFIDQSSVDKSTEQWLDQIEGILSYKKWYCGHYHTTKRIDRMQFMFEDIGRLSVSTE